MNDPSKIWRVRKDDLPLPVVIEGDGGACEVMELRPAGKRKLGASLVRAEAGMKEAVLRTRDHK